jgi:hypothetical protein
LNHMRERVREIDEERQRLGAVDAFAVPADQQPTPDLLPAEGERGMAGNFQGSQYHRREEGDVHSPGLEKALADLHDQLVTYQPTLLPLLRKLGNEIYFERTRHLEQRADLLRHVYPIGSSREPGGPPPFYRSSAMQKERESANTAAGLLAPPPPPAPHERHPISQGVRGDSTALRGGLLSGPPGGGYQRGGTTPVTGASTYDHMANMRAARERRAAAEAMRVEKVQHLERSARVRWDSVGF